jgi:catechol 2,3-dioxygenase
MWGFETHGEAPDGSTMQPRALEAKHSQFLSTSSHSGLAFFGNHDYFVTMNVTDQSIATQNFVAPAGTNIGHVHLKVADIPRALGFYCGVLGFELQQMFGDQAAFISAGGYHHHIGLNTWESKGGSPPPPGTTGLYHTAILYPTKPDLANAFKRVLGAGLKLDGAADHGVSLALYLRDPDENGVELYWDKPKSEWPYGPDGKLAMVNARVDLKDLLNQATI